MGSLPFQGLSVSPSSLFMSLSCLGETLLPLTQNAWGQRMPKKAREERQKGCVQAVRERSFLERSARAWVWQKVPAMSVPRQMCKNPRRWLHGRGGASSLHRFSMSPPLAYITYQPRMSPPTRPHRPHLFLQSIGAEFTWKQAGRWRGEKGNVPASVCPVHCHALHACRMPFFF